MLNTNIINKVMKVEYQSVTSLSWEIASKLKGLVNMDDMFNSVFCVAYLAHLCIENGLNDNESIQKYLKHNASDERQLFISESLRESNLDIAELAKKYDDMTFLALIYQTTDEVCNRRPETSSTPKGLANLALRIMNISDKDNVADFGCGTGGVLLTAASEAANASYYGVELNIRSSEVAKIKAEMFIKNCQIETRDMFDVDRHKKFTKIFSNYPFGMKLSGYGSGNIYFNELTQRVPDIRRATSYEWIYNTLLLDHLAEDGEAVGIMTNGSTWNSIDSKIREYFIENGFIKCMIALPVRIFPYTTVATTMIILDHKNNKSIRMVDARGIYTSTRRSNELSDENIEQILSAVKKDSPVSKNIKIEEIRKNDYTLNPSRYFEEEINVNDGQAFETVIKRITRGAQLTASDLDELVSKEPTEIQYMMLSNIKEGMISDDLPYLKELDEKYEKYCIRDKNMLISKNGVPFKVAVAEIGEKKVLANGNLYIIELDENVIDPYFLKAFLESEDGSLSLERLAVGATIPNIPLNSLMKMTIPVPPLEKQHKIAERYLAKEDEIKVLKLKLQKAKNDIRTIFDEEVE